MENRLFQFGNHEVRVVVAENNGVYLHPLKVSIVQPLKKMYDGK